MVDLIWKDAELPLRKFWDPNPFRRRDVAQEDAHGGAEDNSNRVHINVEVVASAARAVHREALKKEARKRKQASKRMHAQARHEASLGKKTWSCRLGTPLNYASLMSTAPSSRWRPSVNTLCLASWRRMSMSA